MAKHKRPVEEEDEPAFQISTMVDVLMTLLLFFIATATTEVLEQSSDVDLPEATDALDPEEAQGQITVNISRVFFKITIGAEEKAYTPEELTPRIAKHRELVNKIGKAQPRVLIRADREASYELIKEVMKAAAAAGVPDIVFATSEGGGGDAPTEG